MHEHENSEMHREAVMKVAAKLSTASIGYQLLKHYDADTENHRQMLLKVFVVMAESRMDSSLCLSVFQYTCTLTHA